jgi:hypothetical protein
MKNLRIFFQISLMLFLIPCLIYTEKTHLEKTTHQSCYKEDKNNKKNEEPIPFGNFSLPTSQQPGPLASFGQNILDKGQTQIFLFADAFIGKNSYLTDIFPSVLYGITNDLYFFFNVPFSPGNKDRDNHSSGLEDIFAQLEYTFYLKKTSHTVDQATIVANVTFPSGSISKIPPTGFGSNSFFIGATFNHMEINWFFFTSPGAILTTSKHGTKFGNQFLYEFGIGRNISSPSGWIFAWMVELDGLYSWKNKFHGITDPNSGGNIIYITPSIWISSKRLILQFGPGYPIVQHLFGNQSKKFLSFDFNLGITF